NNLPPYNHMQAHAPVREQQDADGHAVRACYLYAAMASVAKATGDQSLVDACHTLWDSVTTKRMYITGGVGSSRFGERFTFDYDLPNEEA
ncbi:glycoside hydrolase family 127 protein, partial [Escherichia coli]